MKDIEQIIAGQEEEFKKEFGAVFSFPPTATNATAHIKGLNGEPQIYAGRYDTHTILDFIRSSIKEILEGVKQRKKDLLERCDECDNAEIHEENPTNKIHLADINRLEEIINKLK